MNCLNTFFKYFGKVINMLKISCLDMMIFSDLSSNKILVDEAR